MDYRKNPPTNNELQKWVKDKTVNPRTNKKILPGKRIYQILEKTYDKEFDQPVDRYLKFRKEMIDPLTLEPLKDIPKKSLFQFKYKWNPYTGERLGVDENGPLYFDPNSLVRYFYMNRLNHLWDSEFNIYGDAVGNGPDFLVKSRGEHPEWYLFRLPIPDGYLDKQHCEQSVTMGPMLLLKEIREIDKLAKIDKNRYYQLYKRRRPVLMQIKRRYDTATSPEPNINVDPEVIPFVDPLQIKQMRDKVNRRAVNWLRMY